MDVTVGGNIETKGFKKPMFSEIVSFTFGNCNTPEATRPAVIIVKPIVS
jgi:hypothetical protein